MATGDQSDVLARLKSVLPSRWFVSPTPILDGVLTGFAYCASFAYSLISYAKLQTRIKTATDGWLDIIAADYFGAMIFRQSNQSDASFLARIVSNLVRERATRFSITKVLQDITGRTPIIFEPARPADTGAYNSGQSLAYGQAGGWGSLLLPYQAFVKALRPMNSGVPNVGAYSSMGDVQNTGYPLWGYLIPKQDRVINGPGCYYNPLVINPPVGSGYSMWGTFVPEQQFKTPATQFEYASTAMFESSLVNADIFAAVDSVKPVGTILWVSIGN